MPIQLSIHKHCIQNIKLSCVRVCARARACLGVCVCVCVCAWGRTYLCASSSLFAFVLHYQIYWLEQ